MQDEHNNEPAQNEDVYVANPDEDYYEDEYLPELPGWPKPVGILSIVFGALAVTCMGVSLGMMGFSGQMMSGSMDGDPLPPSMQINLGIILQGIAAVLMNVLLIIAGVTCVSRRYATRMIHLVYAIAMVVLTVIGAFVQLRILNEMDQYVIDYPDNMFSMSYSRTAAMIQAGIALGIGLIWPIFCLIWFGLVKKTEHDLTGGAEIDAI